MTPDSIGLVEAHGTATAIGDPIEVTALTQAFRRGTADVGFCAIGSVKGNLGHLDAAAGATGLIKATLALRNELIPQSLHVERPNSTLRLEESPFFVAKEARAWTRGEAPRRAGVSSFGIGGTNAHVVLEEAPLAEPSGTSRNSQLLVLSARSAKALDAAAQRLADYLQGHREVPLADIAYTLQIGRTQHEHRRALVVSDHEQAATLLRSSPAGQVFGREASQKPRLVFMFPGGGTQRVRMGEELYRNEPIYRQAFDRCAALFAQHLHVSLTDCLFPAPGAEDEAAQRLLRPSLNMAAIFVTEYALVELFASFGVKPALVTGHSLGEYTAAFCAGVLSLEDAVALVALRGQLSDEMPDSAMLSVGLSESAIASRLREGLSLAAVNGREHCVVSGVASAVRALEEELKREGIHCQRVPIAMAPHSELVAPFAERLSERAQRMTLRAPVLPMITNLDGRRLDAQAAQDPRHWARHLRQTVRFADGLSTLLEEPNTLLIEVGPGKTLATLSQLHPAIGGRTVLTTMSYAGSSRNELATLLFALGQLWCSGYELDLAALTRDEQRRRVRLPTYPFERQSYMLEVPRFPRSEKPLRRAMPIVAQESTAAPPIAEPERPGIKGALARIWEDTLGVRGIGDSDNFFDLGGSSLLAVKVRAEVKDRLGIALPTHALLEHPELKALARHTESLLETQQKQIDGETADASRKTPLLVPLQRSVPAGQSLFLVQPIGGTVYTYQPLAKQLHGVMNVYGLRASGMEPGEPILSDVAQMAAQNLDAIFTVQPRGPYLLGGHSSGGVIAYEMARQLTARGEVVEAVLMFDTISLEQTRAAAFIAPDDVLKYFAPFAVRAPQAWQSFCAAMEKDSSFRAIILATNRAIAAYKPEPSATPICFFRAEERDEVLEHHPELGWVQLADAGFSLRRVAGNHLNMIEDPHAAPLAKLILRELRHASTRLSA